MIWRFEMSEKKRSRREEYTIRVIRETFLEMLKKERLERISVGDLCKIADINRSTFYRHYADIYELLDTICDECYEMLIGTIPSTRDMFFSGYDLVYHACAITEANKDLYQLLLFHQPSSPLLQRMNDGIFQLYNRHHDLTLLRTGETELHYRYLISGILGIWQTWLKNDCAVAKETVAEIVILHIGGVMQVINDRHKEKTE